MKKKGESETGGEKRRWFYRWPVARWLWKEGRTRSPHVRNAIRCSREVSERKTTYL